MSNRRCPRCGDIGCSLQCSLKHARALDQRARRRQAIRDTERLVVVDAVERYLALGCSEEQALELASKASTLRPTPSTIINWRARLSRG